MKDINEMGMAQTANVTANKGIDAVLGLENYYHVECYDVDGNFKWKETIRNLVTNEGLDYVLNVMFKGTGATATWYVGLKGTGAPAAGNTAANLPASNGWTEYEDYTEGVRQTLTLGSVSGQSVTTSSPAAFSIDTPAGDVYGVFLVDSDNKGGNTGATYLYGVGDFGAAKVVDAGDTLNVSVTLTAASA